MENSESCSICHQPWELNPFTQEWTCFTHGRPDGSEFECKMWASRSYTPVEVLSIHPKEN